ncbi:MAG: aldehyde dehydrogenase family protein [Bacillota bacterium]|jgi:acyl-CoA reductase-like NAD-dependent aldehyde dehydrogenase|nr:aldehyde dehydrogenase family protein [Bacillota bacterium]
MINPYQYIQEEPYPLYINGEFVPSASGETAPAINPVNNQVFASIYQGGREDVMKAIAAARDAFDNGPWGKMTHFQRSNLLLKARDLLAERQNEFACVETLDCGKVFPSVLYYELPQALDALQYFAGKARSGLEGQVVPVDGGGRYLNYVTWEPCGVVGEILPWNGPLMMGCQKIAAILAAGNTVVVKPSSWAALSMLKLAEVFHDAGFPPGAVNVVTGPGALVGDLLVKSKDVDMVSLTGGTETGKQIIESSAATVKHLALELGGKSPNIIFDDVDVENAAKWALWGFTLNSGQVCVSGTRILVQESIYERFLETLVDLCQHFKLGDGFDFQNGVNFGPLISKEHFQTVLGYIEKGKAEGARLVAGGSPASGKLAEGNFIPPTIFADVTPEMTIFREEIFGPVACVSPFATEEEAIHLANAVDFGLAGAVFTENVRRALRVAAKINGGQIYVNTYFSKGMIESPGTGWKQSGLGVAGIHKYMRSKTTFVELGDGVEPPM